MTPHGMFRHTAAGRTSRVSFGPVPLPGSPGEAASAVVRPDRPHPDLLPRRSKKLGEERTRHSGAESPGIGTDSRGDGAIHPALLGGGTVPVPDELLPPDRVPRPVKGGGAGGLLGAGDRPGEPGSPAPPHPHGSLRSRAGPAPDRGEGVRRRRPSAALRTGQERPGRHEVRRQGPDRGSGRPAGGAAVSAEVRPPTVRSMRRVLRADEGRTVGGMPAGVVRQIRPTSERQRGSQEGRDRSGAVEIHRTDLDRP